MKFSVIVAAYNVVEYLTDCVDSIAQQHFPASEFEVLIINDGSTDQLTGPLCDELAQKYEMVKVIHQPNGGLSSARNTGIKNANGDYLLFVDGDDFWENLDFLALLLQNIQTYNSDLVIFSYDKYYGKDDISTVMFETVRQFGNFSENALELASKGVLTAPAWNKCVKKEFFDNGLDFPVGFLSEDCLYCADVIKVIGTYSILNIDCYKYRQNRIGSITNIVKEKNVHDILKSIDLGMSDIGTFEESIQKSLELYFTISYISILPYVNPYLGNNDIESLLRRYHYLLKYSKYISNKAFKFTGFIAKLFGIKFSTTLFSYLLRYYKKRH
ncbi:glycosyltransferase family 2 protein [Streptococcus acidominimus]|uniref:Glycosyltransferase family 2 protein n=1 Tax=Streptococcus acidominimus TaxID=1326 RepID=A0A4Y9FS41_STRAI|nr:glycosyltransferase family 2 protein [Streptococcus acidominimus]MBF0818579.1 glycosyltransferase family 2 protein [Streptococcus acidominimus]MBF0838215.1 glycosyltransferase family 2 protein [Streptococcus acidominimus]MBF0847995.1 glycosyltransferase family 2 protein [Streptococcus danieliae]TFU31079.1 glycosyltransferase family 2 protein [Streptococcus acidominimus]